MKKEVRIIPKRKAIDVERLAEALLDLASHLDGAFDQKIAVEADVIRRQLKGGRRARKGSAA